MEETAEVFWKLKNSVFIYDFQSFIFFFFGGGVHVKFQGCNKYLAYMVVVYMG